MVSKILGTTIAFEVHNFKHLDCGSLQQSESIALMNNKLRLQVEGWRGISHSYALVNQFQLLAWAHNPHIELGHIDVPYFFDTWGKNKNPSGLTEKDQTSIDQLIPLTEFDAVFRIYSPFNLKPMPSKRTGVFMVTEFGLDVTTVKLEDAPSLRDEGGFIVTPSNWSKERLLANGLPESIVHVVPHSVDPSYFHPHSAELIAHQRAALGFREDEVVLLNVGTQHWAKGMDLLLRAFAIARKTHKELRLVLKDQRNTYTLNTEEFIYQTLSEHGLLSEDVIKAIMMIPVNLSLEELNSLYNIADAYVSPYRAEGYNLPAHEAQHCMTPLIVTANGATQDFAEKGINQFIAGKQHYNASLKSEIPVNSYIEPDLESLVEIIKKTSRKQFQTIEKKYTPSSWMECSDKIYKIYQCK